MSEHLNRPETSEGRYDYGDVIVERASVSAIMRYVDDHWEHLFLSPEGNLAYEITPNHPGSQLDSDELLPWSAVVTTPDHPGIIFDDGAAFCSPTIVFDEAGNAVHLHESPLGDLGSYHNLKERYVPHLQNYIGEGQVTFAIGGSNLWLEDNKEVTDVVDEAALWTDSHVREVFPKARSIALIAKRREHQFRVADTSLIPAENPTARGYVFIPRYIANDDKNHLMPILDGDDLIMRDEFGL